MTCAAALRGKRLAVTVSDDGRGIAPPDLPHLFERFYRANKARTRDVQGVGLGLALVRAIVHAYGGQIEIESAGLGQGTTVHVWWPLGVPDGTGKLPENPDF